MIRRFIVQGKFDNLNKLLGATNHNRYVGAGIKKRNQKIFEEQLMNEDPLEPHGNYTFKWHKSTKREDPDNIATSIKYFFDAIQEIGLIPNDNWVYVKSIHHEFYNDAKEDFEFVEIEVTYDD